MTVEKKEKKREMKINLGEITSWENCIKGFCFQGREIKPRQITGRPSGSREQDGNIPTEFLQGWPADAVSAAAPPLQIVSHQPRPLITQGGLENRDFAETPIS